jgi:hypothetical protein
LETALNLGQLLAAAKLLEDNLGLKGLLAQLLPSIVPTLNAQEMIAQVRQEDKQGLAELYIQIKEDFIAKGYPEDKAQFFAQVGTELTQHGLLTPNVTTNISEKTINQPLLFNSIKSQLALSDKYSLPQSSQITDKALFRTMEDAPYFSAQKFRATLASHLTILDVKNSSEVAAAAVLILPTEKSLASMLPATPSSTTQITSKPISHSIDPKNAPTPALSTDIPPSSPLPIQIPIELTNIIDKRVQQLLVPQLGPQLAKQMSQEITKTLFGNLNPDSQDIVNIKSPYALINLLHDQFYHINIQDSANWANIVHTTFTESLKVVTSFPAFAKKLQDPAYKYVLALSIIYGDPARKNAIDIPI